MSAADGSNQGWIDETRVLSVLGISRSTFVGWHRSGLVVRDDGGAYDRCQLIEFVLLAALREHFSVDDLTARWQRLTEQGRVAAFVDASLTFGAEQPLELVVEITHGGVSVARSDAELAAAVRRGVARPVVVLDVKDAVRDAREAFENWARYTARPTRRKVGRPAKAPAEVRHLRSA